MPPLGVSHKYEIVVVAVVRMRILRVCVFQVLSEYLTSCADNKTLMSDGEL